MFFIIMSQWHPFPARLKALLLLVCTVAVPAQAQTLLSENDALYPRVVQLSHNGDADKNGAIIASTVSFAGGTGHADIFVSRDNGESFELLTEIHDEDFQSGLCCGGLYELLMPVNELAAGTLLWAGSVGQEDLSEPMEMKIYASTDQGETWNYLSSCLTASAPTNEGGIWEAEFAIADTGELVCYYADETLPNHSQVLRYTKSGDGINWSEPVDVVTSNDPTDRPGMPVVVPLPTGEFAMSYEICGRLRCATYMRTSPDGLDWGNPTDLGEPVVSTDGLTFWATPTMTLAPRPDSEGRQLVLQGHTLVKDNVEQPGNGATLFISRSGDPFGPWKAYDSPMPVELPPGTEVDYCQNYSSPLLALGAGRKLLQLASDFSDDGICRTRFNVGPLGGVRASVDNFSVENDQDGSTDVRLHVSPGYSGDYTLSVSIPELGKDVSLSQSQVTVLSDRDATVTLSVGSDSVATAVGMASVYAGVLCAPCLLFWSAPGSRRRRLLLGVVLLVPFVLTGCGGGSGSGLDGPGPNVSTRYTGTLTAVSVDYPDVRTSTQFTVTVVESE